MNKISLRILLFLLLAGAFSAFGGTYYIDYVNGSDSNNGTSKSTPWKRHPYMVGFSGSYNHSAGDKFIFKGGVTWAAACFGMTIANGGNASAYDYYGVDQTWYSGSSWTRPVFDGGGPPVIITVFMYLPVNNSDNYIIIDNIEMTDFYWDASAAYGTSYISVGGNNYVVIQNCYFHGWQHASDATDAMQVIIGGTAYPNTGCVISNCVFDGASAGGNSGMAVYCMPVVKNCIITNVSNAILCNGGAASTGGAAVNGGEVSGNLIGPINISFDPTQHENAIETAGSNAGLVYIHHNTIFGAVAVCIFVGNPGGGPGYIYDNLIFNSSPIPVQADGRSGTGALYVYNNTIISTTPGSAFRCVDTLTGASTGVAWTLVAENNQLIDGDDGGGFSPVTELNNLDQSSAQASADGYSQANLYQPISLSEPTVGAGLNLSSTGLPGIMTDLLGNPRPTTGAWNIGAYQFTTNGNSGQPTNNNQPPVVSAITQNIADVDPNTPGIQVYAGTTVQYSASATDPSGNPVTWQWSYTVNGGSSTVFQSGSGTIPSISYSYPANSAGNTYVWTLAVSNGPSLTGQSQLTVSVEAPLAESGLTFSATSGVITSPFIVTNGYIYQSVQTLITNVGISNCGTATYTFTITNAGNYVVQCLVQATNEGMDSFYVNIDAMPTDPYMVWKILPLTVGFQNEEVSWEGTGTYDAPEFAPEVFNLTAGTHQLIIVGREAYAELQSISILQRLAPPQDLQVLPTIVQSPVFPLQ